MTDPVSALVVRVPFTRTSQLPPPATKEIQQQLANLKIRQKRLLYFSTQNVQTPLFIPSAREATLVPNSFYGSSQATNISFVGISISATHVASKDVSPAAL